MKSSSGKPKRLKELERENAMLTLTAADKEPEIVALKESRRKLGGHSPQSWGGRDAPGASQHRQALQAYVVVGQHRSA